MRGGLLVLFCGLTIGAAAADSIRPNILWITSEDHGPHMGCYGDSYATTPHVDALAAKGLRYLHCWSNAPVCAPARTTLISGMYPPGTGGEHMRSMAPFPQGKMMFPQFLREAGYYCTNNSKEDYNLTKPGVVWDDSSKNGQWRHRAPGQPFFAVFNSLKSHESQIRARPHTLVHDPAMVRVPAYHPDTPEVRRDWAQYYDVVSEADADAGRLLEQLEQDGLTEDTIVFYYADHGSGMPRSKRWPYNSGLQVPLVIFIPETFKELRPPEYKPGGASERLVSFVDFAPTLLSLAGLKPPDWMQGHAFLGRYVEPLQPFLYGFRGRMDERYDCVRSVTDGRYVYIRNFRPDKIYAQHIDYMWQTPTTRVWEQMFIDGKLDAAQSAFWKPKPVEEFYDLQSDPDEVRNLAASTEHRPTLEKLRAALREHEFRTRDVGLLPEGEMHRRSVDSTPYDMGHDTTKYPFARIYRIAELASAIESNAVPSLIEALHDSDAGVRYWGALGLEMRGAEAVKSADAQLENALADPSPDVRVVAAETLARFGNATDLDLARACLVRHADWSKNDVFTVMAALNALDAIGDRAAPLAVAIKALPAKGDAPHARFNEYVPRLLEELQARFK